MIIQIMGTGGSGKTTMARAIMSAYNVSRAVTELRGTKMKEATKGYILSCEGFPNLRVIGKYENVCGGADTISDIEDIVKDIREGVAAGDDVMLEGMMVSTATRALPALEDELGVPWLRVFLPTPLDVCIERIKQRRLAAGNEKEFNPENTAAKHKNIATFQGKCELLGRHNLVTDNPNLVLSYLNRSLPIEETKSKVVV